MPQAAYGFVAMRWTVIFLMTALMGLGSLEAGAKYVIEQTQQVPIGRLFTNLQVRLAKDTNNVEVTYDLARLHAMAYSTNLSSFAVKTNSGRPKFYYPGVDTGVPENVHLPAPGAERIRALEHLTNSIRWFNQAIYLLRTSTNNSPSKEWLVLPMELGRAWCIDQSGARDDALAHYRKALALAWKREVTGKFDFAEWVKGKWELLKEGSNPMRPSPDGRGHLGSIVYSEEIIRYMLKLLDPKKDAEEIADLQRRLKTLAKMGRMVTPILIPLAKDSAFRELVDERAAVTFDLDGSGLPRQWGWITPKAAWLVFDREGSGRITSGLQLFGNVTFWIFWQDGYAALRSLDDNGDGVLRGEELRGLALWHDGNSNGRSEEGEVRPVTAWGINSLSCTGQPDAAGMAWSPAGVTFDHGEVRPTYDWMAPMRPEAK